MKDKLSIEFLLDPKLANNLEAIRVKRGLDRNVLFEEIIKDYLNRQSLNTDKINSSTNTIRHAGLLKTKEYNCWSSTIQRCYNQANPRFINYGGEGIEVCSEWKDNFDAFLNDMGKAPTSEHNLGRLNVKENYSKDNCKWMTSVELAQSREGTRQFTYAGKTLSIREWSVETGINSQCIVSRLKRDWTIGEALDFVPRPKSSTSRIVRYYSKFE